MPKKLPIVLVKGEKFILDERLEELRAVDNPNNKIPFSQTDIICIEMDDEYDAELVAELFEVYDIHSDGNLVCFDIDGFSDLQSEVEVKEELFASLRKKIFGEEF